MAQDIARRLQQLRTRRRGTDRLQRIAADSQVEVLAKSLLQESWEKRAGTQPYTQYALGAMQEVDADYTRISIETAQRVGRQLNAALIKAGYAVQFRLQGSVPLNVHVRGVSDVDLLNIDASFYTYAVVGQKSQQGLYTTPSIRSSVEVLSTLRAEAEKVLKQAFPAAKVVTSGGKAINISGGSLARPVDVVVSHWYDTVEYQASNQEHDRALTILDKKDGTTIDNLPFLHIKRISERCDAAFGGLRKAIRLCKNVKAEAELEGKDIALPSFDIAAAMYHADVSALMSGCLYELAILAETQRHLDILARNHEYARTLRVPDGSRFIFDSSSKLTGLTQLSIEMDALAGEVAKEQNPRLAALTNPTLADSRAAISSVYIPAS